MTTFETSRQIPATPTEVFTAFESPARLAKWWGPQGFSNTFEVCDFKPGGAWKFTMHGPDGTDYPNESVFVEIERDQKNRDSACLRADISAHGDAVAQCSWNLADVVTGI